MMKKYLLSILLLVGAVPSMLCMDWKRKPLEGDRDYIFTVMEKVRNQDWINFDLFLRNHRTDVNALTLVRDRYGMRLTPPLAAIGFDITPDVVNSLINHGANVNITIDDKDPYSNLFNRITLLSWFVLHYLDRDEQFVDIIKDRELIRLLIACGANTDKCYDECVSTIRNKQNCATVSQGPLIAHVLRARNNPFSHLVDAIDRGDIEEIITICIQDNTLVNHRDEFGFTPLAYSLLRGWGRVLNKDVIVSLLELGAHGNDKLVSTADGRDYGKSAMNVATDNFLDEVKAALRAQEQNQLRAELGQEGCAVCLNKPDQNTRVQKLRCGHIFCANCLQDLHNKLCPLCRAPIS